MKINFSNISIVCFMLLNISCTKNKNYFECAQENEKHYYGKWTIQVFSRDSVNSTAHLIFDGLKANLADDEDHLTTVNQISLSSIAIPSMMFLNDGNNAQVWYWAPDLTCNSHMRFNINTTGFRDLMVTFNVTEFSENKVVMNCMFKAGSGDVGNFGYIEEWVWTRQ
jgi:hypothetical protein